MKPKALSVHGRLLSVLYGAMLLLGATIAEAQAQEREDWIERIQQSVDPSGAGIRGFRIRGTAEVNNTDGSRASYPVEIRLAFPSGYLRIESQDLVVRRAGFTAESLLNDVRVSRAGVNPIVRYPENQIDLERAAMRRLALGIAAMLMPGTEVGDVMDETVEGRRLLVASLSDPLLADLRLGVDPDTQLPVAVITRQPVRLPVDRPEQGPPPPQVLDVVEIFDDRRTVSGYRMPLRIRRMAGGVTLETITVSEVEMNPQFSPGDFAE